MRSTRNSNCMVVLEEVPSSICSSSSSSNSSCSYGSSMVVEEIIAIDEEKEDLGVNNYHPNIPINNSTRTYEQFSVVSFFFA